MSVELFESTEHRRDTSLFGMWVFIITEILLFGAIFLAFFVYHYWYPEAFHAASRELNVFLGATNTTILLLSSLTMALAVHAAHGRRRKPTLWFLFVTVALGLLFLGIKGVEYGEKFKHHLYPGFNFIYAGPDPVHAKLFFGLYFALTGLHAVHVLAGLGVLTTIFGLIASGRLKETYDIPVEVSGLYWHLVDVVWIFLFPLLYLIGLHG